MEDISRVQKKPASTDDRDKKMIDLTPEMEIGPEKGGKIYDLTQASDGTVYPVPDTQMLHESRAKESEPQPSAQADTAVHSISEIEQEIDAAFDNIEPYSPIDLSSGIDDKAPIPDKLGDLQQMADDVISETSPISDEAGIERDEPVRETVRDVPPPEADPSADMDIGQKEEADAGNEIVELTDDVSSREIPEFLSEPPQKPVEPLQMEAEPEDEEIIDLVDIVSFGPAGGVSPEAIPTPPETGGEEDEIIELVDIVLTKPKPVEMEDATAMAMDEDAEALIELTDIVDLTPGTAPDETGISKYADRGPDLERQETAKPPYQETQGAPADDQIIQLSDVLRNTRNRDAMEALPNLDDSGEDDRNEAQDLSAGIGMVLEDRPAGISNEAIEAAIERYIRARYDGDLERMIAAVVEKAVAREIEHLKRSFMDENEEPE